VLEAVEGVADVEDVVWVRVYRSPGATLGPLRSGADRVGAILAVGATREEALERADRAASAIRLVTVEEPMVPPRAPSFLRARGNACLRSGEIAVSPPRALACDFEPGKR
jgi:hypothetical protein